MEKVEIQPYDLTTDPPDPRLEESANKFLKAGRQFDFSADWKTALQAYCWARRIYRNLSGEGFREKEALALHYCAIALLSIAESISEWQQKADCYSHAADFFMRQAWVCERANKLKQAQDAYRNASHRYYWGDELEKSAETASDCAEVSEKLGDIVNAQQEFELAAQRLDEAERAQTSTSNVDTLRHIKADWLRRAGYHGKALGKQEDKGKSLRAFNSAIAAKLSTIYPDLEEAIGDHFEAIRLSEELQRFKELDSLRYSLCNLQRKKASEEGQLLFVIWSYFNDWLWGYGAKYFRLFRTAAFVIIVFGFIYFFLGDVQLKNKPIDRVNAPGLYGLICIGYSLYSLLPTGVIEWLTGSGVVVEFDIKGVTKLLSRVESLIGLVWLTLATLLVKRALGRLSNAKVD